MGLKSMTGYGRSSLKEKGVQLAVEILSVNRKHLDINIILPRHLVRFDPMIRKIVGSTVFRGHLTVRISAAFVGDSPLLVRPNLALAKQVHQGWQEIAHALDQEDAFSLALLEKEPDLFIYEETSEMEALGVLLEKGVHQALIPFNKMRQSEGEQLQKDIATRLKLLREKMGAIQIQSQGATDKYRKKLIEKMQAVLPTVDTTDERLIKEIAIFAEKIDVEEEVVRFLSHLDQFEKLLQSDQEAQGKTAEFILQELGRETNTTGSKSSELAITRVVVDIKAELERIREQIQNIE